MGTMNISHFDDALLALKAGKHCLLEKVGFRLISEPTISSRQPATLNAEEWKVLSDLAKQKDVFLMEGQSFPVYMPQGVEEAWQH